MSVWGTLNEDFTPGGGEFKPDMLSAGGASTPKITKKKEVKSENETRALRGQNREPSNPASCFQQGAARGFGDAKATRRKPFSCGRPPEQLVSPVSETPPLSYCSSLLRHPDAPQGTCCNRQKRVATANARLVWLSGRHIMKAKRGRAAIACAKHPPTPFLQHRLPSLALSLLRPPRRFQGPAGSRLLHCLFFPGFLNGRASVAPSLRPSGEGRPRISAWKTSHRPAHAPAAARGCSEPSKPPTHPPKPCRRPFALTHRGRSAGAGAAASMARLHSLEILQQGREEKAGAFR